MEECVDHFELSSLDMEDGLDLCKVLDCLNRLIKTDISDLRGLGVRIGRAYHVTHDGTLVLPVDWVL